MIRLGPDLADSGDRLQQVDDAHLADHLVAVTLVQHVDDRGPGVLQPVLHLGPLPPRRGRLVESGLTLFGSQGRKSHGCLLDERLG